MPGVCHGNDRTSGITPVVRKEMWRKYYNLYIAPRQGDEDARNREFVLHVLLAGAVATMLLALVVLCNSYFILGSKSALATLLSVLVMLAVAAGIYKLSRRGWHKAAAYAFIGLYFIIAVGAALTWGVTMPATVALFGLIVVLCGILVGARYSLYGFGVMAVTFFVLRMLQSSGVYHPDLSWTSDPSGADELIGVVLVFGVIAIVSWLFNFRMERSLHRAERAETALRRQKAELEKMVEKRTRELQVAQLEKVQELYRFAELGQSSTALMHELANHLTTLTLDIESLHAENRSSMLTRAKRNMHYIDKMVLQVRDQLRGKTRARTFDAAGEAKAVLDILQHKAIQAEVSLQWQQSDDQKLRVHGDPLRFRQLLANVVSNGIDAYEDGLENRQVIVGATANKDLVTIRVEDWGRGIKEADRAKLFDPFFGTKKRGMGLGLFIARQIAQDHFSGNVTLDVSSSHTVFVITLKAA